MLQIGVVYTFKVNYHIGAHLLWWSLMRYTFASHPIRVCDTTGSGRGLNMTMCAKILVYNLVHSKQIVGRKKAR